MIDLFQGDCAQVLTTLAGESVDLTVTSPPYDNLRKYKGYVFDFEPIARELYRVTKPGRVVVWVVGDATINGSETGTSFRQALYFKEIGFNLHDTMIYRMPGTGAKGSNLAYWQAFEYMFVLSKGTPKTVNRLKDKKNKRAGSSTKGKNSVGTRAHSENVITGEYGYRENVWEIQCGNNGDDRTGHPAPFPEALARDHILSWSNPGDTVLDPMMGSGTTGKMAVLNNRNFIGIEIAAEYFQLAERRIMTQVETA
jgi:DNA modification methylase